MKHVSLRIVVALCAIYLVAGVARTDVLIVDASGGGRFTTIQSAVDAAHDRDVLLVKSGTYASFTIINKALIVAGDTNASVTVNGAAQISNLSVDRTVLLSNLILHAQAGALDWQSHGVHLLDNLGAVRVQGCYVIGAFTASTTPPSSTGAYVEFSMDVAFQNSFVRGGYWANPLAPHSSAPSGLVNVGSSIAIYDSQVFGGQGYTDPCTQIDLNGGNGGPGVVGQSSFLFASGSIISGGDGGYGSDCGQGDGGSGGVGISLSSSTVDLLDTVVAGGMGGPGSCSIGCGHDGQNGAASTIDASSALNSLAASKRVLEAPLVVRELSPFPLRIRGQPGDEVGVIVGTRTAFELMPLLNGVELVATDRDPVWLGHADSMTGLFSTNLSFPDLGSGVQSSTYYMQVIARSPHGAHILGTPIGVTVLDSSF
jgi:hypothetical protein